MTQFDNLFPDGYEKAYKENSIAVYLRLLHVSLRKEPVHLTINGVTLTPLKKELNAVISGKTILQLRDLRSFVKRANLAGCTAENPNWNKLSRFVLSWNEVKCTDVDISDFTRALRSAMESQNVSSNAVDQAVGDAGGRSDFYRLLLTRGDLLEVELEVIASLLQVDRQILTIQVKNLGKVSKFPDLSMKMNLQKTRMQATNEALQSDRLAVDRENNRREEEATLCSTQRALLHKLTCTDSDKKNSIDALGECQEKAYLSILSEKRAMLTKVSQQLIATRRLLAAEVKRHKHKVRKQQKANQEAQRKASQVATHLLQMEILRKREAQVNETRLNSVS